MQMSRVLNNTKWIIACKIVQSLVQFLVGMLTARYLGPSNYGLINYAASITAFAVPIMQLGLQFTMVQEYVCMPEREGEILGTSLLMNMLSALACMVGVTTFASVANPNEKVTVLICALYSSSLIFQAVDMVQYWFQAKLLSKYSSSAMLFAYIVTSAYKVFLLISGRSVYWFALSYTVENTFMGIFLMFALRKCGVGRISVSFSLAMKMFSTSKHYILASLATVFWLRIGNILLKNYWGAEENGYYAAAVTCTLILNFVIDAIIDSARPVLLESRKKSIDLFESNVSKVYSVMIYFTLAESLGFTAFSRIIVRVLYGNAYIPAVPVLCILTWNTAFSYMGTVRNIWILGEEKHRYLWIINLGGAIAGLVLNLLLIPTWGACGAAVATVLVQVFTNVIMGYILKPIRRNNYLILRGLNPKLAVDLVKTFLAR